ncbi:hypothetical protein BDP27DRAFT_555114 [Rhodocollybia butyracea]|uniref:Uncharacterized protein n=1 Tax=Rhodocollybia butyracea TaxID=206335 RepID=A0A9P5U9M5_9AGAR|nr:hypothetical protein BDP27DRAFT_555114 [Rhodocollybia butyracea]
MDVFSRNDTRRGTDADVASTSRISRAPGASRSTAPRDQSQPSRNPRNPGIDSQESKLNQQFYTPSTSLAARSSPRPLTSSPEQFITDWSDSVRGGSPPGDPGSDITEEEEGEKEEDLFVRDDDDEVEMEMEMEEVLTAGDNKEEKEKDLFSDDDGEQEIEGRIEHSGISSPPTSSPRRISSRRLPLTPTPAPRRKNSMAPPAFIRDRGVLQPPPPAQPRPPPLTQSTNPPPSQELGTTNISFDLDFTPEPVKNKHSPIKVDSPVPLRVMAMPPPRLRYPERGPYSDTSIILQVIPESSQFRLSPPPPAQPRRKLDSSLDRNPSPSIIDSQGPSSSSVVPRTNPKINKVASAATAPSAVFAVPQRRVPRPHQPVPLVMTSQTIPRILAPDSDTSGTHSQSQNGSQSQEQPQSQSQGQEPGQRQKQEASSKRQSQQSQPSGQSNSVTESDSQPTDTHSKKSELLLVLPQHTENLGTGSDHDDDHDSLFSGQIVMLMLI